MLLTDSTTEPLPLWLEPGPELTDGLAGDGMLSTWDGVSETLQGKKIEDFMLQLDSMRPNNKNNTQV